MDNKVRLNHTFFYENKVEKKNKIISMRAGLVKEKIDLLY